MPVDLSIQNVPDAIATRLRDQAARNHRSVQSEVITLLEQALALGSAPDAADQTQIDAGRRDRIAFVQKQLRRVENAPVAESTALVRDARDRGYSSDTHD